MEWFHHLMAGIQCFFVILGLCIGGCWAVTRFQLTDERGIADATRQELEQRLQEQITVEVRGRALSSNEKVRAVAVSATLVNNGLNNVTIDLLKRHPITIHPISSNGGLMTIGPAIDTVLPEAGPPPEATKKCVLDSIITLVDAAASLPPSSADSSMLFHDSDAAIAHYRRRYTDLIADASNHTILRDHPAVKRLVEIKRNWPKQNVIVRGQSSERIDYLAMLPGKQLYAILYYFEVSEEQRVEWEQTDNAHEVAWEGRRFLYVD